MSYIGEKIDFRFIEFFFFFLFKIAHFLGMYPFGSLMKIIDHFKNSGNNNQKVKQISPPSFPKRRFNDNIQCLCSLFYTSRRICIERDNQPIFSGIQIGIYNRLRAVGRNPLFVESFQFVHYIFWTQPGII